ncbi:hypothetical protein PILCRDRAFT_816573 [Piloderma croceum F 1598]|uniref:Uncharacterized protein n=1 Tax=Piloderma croceum (strain F 1598) TaxID=765440 RepID=A0A0C3G5U5_PILCF|nr:hypothetical protein PILCRDRAFT_816573 [Piloderma croceum F 1598]
MTEDCGMQAELEKCFPKSPQVARYYGTYGKVLNSWQYCLRAVSKITDDEIIE